MKKQLLAFVILLTTFFFFSEMLIAQTDAPDTSWTRVYNYYCEPEYFQMKDIKELDDKSFIILADSSGQGSLVMGADEYGNLTWQLAYPKVFYKIFKWKDNNFLFLSEMGKPLSILNLTGQGDIVWYKEYNIQLDVGMQANWRANWIEEIVDGGFILVSSLYGVMPMEGAFNVEPFIMKFNALGDTVWTKRYRSQYGWFSAAQELPDGSISIFGYNLFVCPDSGLCIINIDSNGEYNWSKCHDYYLDWWDDSRSMIPTSDGGFLLKKYNWIDDVNYLTKFDGDGNISWRKLYQYPEFVDMQETIDGGFIFVSYIKSNYLKFTELLALKLDAQGNKLWQKQLTSNGFSAYPEYAENIGISIDQTWDNGFIIVGITGHGTCIYSWLVRLKPDPSIPANIDKVHNLFPTQFTLEQCVPNPFNSRCQISFNLPKTTQATLTIYDITGRKVKDLVSNRIYTVGRHSVIWDGTNQKNETVGTGIYFYELKTEYDRAVRKMLLVK